jgi:hypothetical protein
MIYGIALTDAKHADDRNAGLDLEKGAVRNNLKAGVLEPSLSKVLSYYIHYHTIPYSNIIMQCHDVVDMTD